MLCATCKHVRQPISSSLFYVILDRENDHNLTSKIEDDKLKVFDSVRVNCCVDIYFASNMHEGKQGNILKHDKVVT